MSNQRCAITSRSLEIAWTSVIAISTIYLCVEVIFFQVRGHLNSDLGIEWALSKLPWIDQLAEQDPEFLPH